MSRVIKFRAWDSQRKIMLDSVNINDERAVEQGYQWINQPTPAAYLKLMQFTGLTDKNGADIYEGDICYVEGLGNGAVEVCSYSGVEFHHVDGHSTSALDCISEQDLFKVIGNIHQNPELLESNHE